MRTARHTSGPLLQGRTAVISGAGRARGIGRATARLFLQHGAAVVLLDLDKGEVAQTAAELAAEESGDAIGLHCDVTDMASCRQAIAQALSWPAAAGRLDVLVNNAGITQKRGISEITAEEYQQVTDVVLRGTLQLSQAALEPMRRQQSGSIISMSSMSAQQGGGMFGGAHYCAAKAGVLGYMRALAREFGPMGIRANSVAPGLTLTDFSRSASTDDAKHASARGWPLPRAASPDEIAGACLFLACDLSSYVTGTTIDVNGGAYMR